MACLDGSVAEVITCAAEWGKEARCLKVLNLTAAFDCLAGLESWHWGIRDADGEVDAGAVKDDSEEDGLQRPEVWTAWAQCMWLRQ